VWQCGVTRDERHRAERMLHTSSSMPTSAAAAMWLAPLTDLTQRIAAARSVAR
jgi:hypothetical protein